MPRYEVNTVVQIFIEVEADSREEAEKIGWEWEDYLHNAEVDSINVYEYPEEN